ncbi:AAA family ATPase, partial [Candidatus Frankia alpina]|uniref:AAA family ATPase n=1 Tax=Candidatus Frankia alpina TaxID=2699483 RepID=UPI001F46BCD3
MTSAPALVLRVRDQASLLTYYERMLEALRGAGPPPLGLVQLVATLDAAERLAWLAPEGATSGAELGADPLLPLPASPEQARVLERLRHDNGIVVEGPPGTGKTHTIANLITALLAEGQRVLVTSQKAQALRVLREKLPPELQRLCVSFTDVEEASGPADGAARVAVRAMDAGGMNRGGMDGVGSPELAASALAAEKAVYHPEALDRRIEQAARRRAEALRARAELAERARAARAAERAAHPDSEVGAAGWGGTRASIAVRVRAGGGAHGWLPLPVPPAGSGGERPAPLTDAEAVELYSLLSAASKDAALPADRADVPVRAVPPILAAERFAALVTADRMARQTAETARAGVATAAARGFLDEVTAAGAGSSPTGPLSAAVTALVRALDNLTAHGARGPAREWIPAALDDALAGRDRLLWAKVSAAAPLIAEAARHVDDLGLHSVALPSAATAPTNPARATDGHHADEHREGEHHEDE